MKISETQYSLYKFIDRIYRCSSLAEAYEVSLESIMEALDSQRASILLCDHGGSMRFVAFRRLSEDYRRAVEGHSPWKCGEQDPQPVLIENIDQADLPQELKNVVKNEGIAALIFIPLAIDGNLLGKFMAYYNSPHTFTRGELDLAMGIGRQLALNIQRRRTEDALRENEQRLKRINHQLVDLTVNLEKRVHERTQQLQEQSEQLRRLAVELTDAEESERKRLAQILHDHLQQLLVAAKMRLELIARRETNLTDKNAFFELRKFIDEAFDSSRSLTAELRPPVLYESGLIPALRFLVRKFFDQYQLAVDFSVDAKAEPSTNFLRSLIYSSVQEILFNTVKYAGVTSCVLQLKRLPDTSLQIIIQDQGRGFDAQTIGRKGSEGFGLFSIRERMKALEGECKIESAPGQGARFEITIPDKKESRVEARKSKGYLVRNQNRKNKEGLTVLLADDHKILRQSLANLLVAQPFIAEVLEAEDGQHAVDQVHETAPDVIIMDLNMPRLNGIEATKIIHQQYPAIKIIGLSIQTEPETMQAMKDHGAIGYFHKGEETDVLIEALKDLSNQSEVVNT